MIKLLIAAHAEGRVALYELRAPVYLNEQFIEAQYQDQFTKAMVAQQIEWPRVPSEAMIPVNETAKEIYAAFKESIGGPSADQPQTLGFVLDGKVVLKARATEAPPVGNAGTYDPRVQQRQAHPVPKSINVLGTIAAPAVEHTLRFDPAPRVA
jgi:hypothetical protein